MKFKGKVKKAAACILCAVMLASSLLAANAATDVCVHTSMHLEGKPQFVSATSLNEGCHRATYKEVRVCDECNKRFDCTRTETETHSMGSYTDEGHSGSNHHTYRAHCSKCGFSQLIEIYCSGGSSHARP